MQSYPRLLTCKPKLFRFIDIHPPGCVELVYVDDTDLISDLKLNDATVQEIITAFGATGPSQQSMPKCIKRCLRTVAGRPS